MSTGTGSPTSSPWGGSTCASFEPDLEKADRHRWEADPRDHQRRHRRPSDSIALDSVKPHGQAFALERALEIALAMPRRDDISTTRSRRTIIRPVRSRPGSHQARIEKAIKNWCSSTGTAKPMLACSAGGHELFTCHTIFGEVTGRAVADSDTKIAAQDLHGGDLDGDGTPDVVAIGGSTHNVVWYRPRTP